MGNRTIYKRCTMAIFTQIGGISTGSITNVLKGPLAALFGKKGTITQYQYPEDLTADPSRMHFIKFDIYNITPVSFGTNECTTDNPSGITVVEKLSKSAALGSTGQINKALSPEKRTTNTSISLFMPDTLNMTYNSSWSGSPLPAAFKIAEVAGSLLDSIKQGKSFSDAFANAGGAATIAAATASSVGVSDTITSLGLKPVGLAMNPQVQMLYHGNDFRDFQFEFILTSKSKEEADQISAICNAFVYASSPSLDRSSLFFIPPSIFNISLRMAKKSNLSGLSAMLQKAGNSLVPGLNIGSKIGSAMGGDSSTENTRLFKVGDCVLKDVIVDYAPNGWAAHTDGAPLQTRLTLQFAETQVVHRDRFNGEIR